MPDSSLEPDLRQLLEYHEAPADEIFVADVMKGVKRVQLTRRLILGSFGLIGALFGLAGAVLLSDHIAHLFSFTVTLPVTKIMQGVLLIVAAAAFYNWMMNDDLHVGN